MINVNFASRNYRAAQSLVRVLFGAAAVLFLAAAGMVWEATTLGRDLSSMQQKLKMAEEEDVRVESTLFERARLVKSLNEMSGIIEARRFSWTQFLTSLEAAVPVGVALKNVVFNPRDRTLSIEGMARSPEALRDLMVGLEKSVAFANPLLKHQSLEKGILSFNVVAVYHEHKNASVAPVDR